MRKIVFAIFIIFAATSAVFLFSVKKNSSKNIQAKVPPSGEKETVSASVMFFGDMMLDRRVFNLTRDSGDWDYPFRTADGILGEADVNVANLEGPVTSNESEASKTNGMKFTVNPAFVPEMAKRFSALNLANNHTLDFGEEGLRETKKLLSENGIRPFGDYFNRGDNISTIIRAGELKIGLVGYHALAQKNTVNAIIDIARLKELCDFVVVTPHWGEEYEPLPSESQIADAKALIDAGADAVIGGHPHVIQPASAHKGKIIFYSLGNFIFDQYFSEDVMKGLAVKAVFSVSGDSRTIGYEIIPLKNDRLSQVRPMETDEALSALSAMASLSDVGEGIKEGIRQGRVFHSSLRLKSE